MLFEVRLQAEGLHLKPIVKKPVIDTVSILISLSILINGWHASALALQVAGRRSTQRACVYRHIDSSVRRR